jgi:hypothetical protein
MSIQRKDRRIPEENRVRVIPLARSGRKVFEEPFEASTKDISLTGMRLITRKGLPLDLDCRIEFTSRSHKPIEVLGRIRWCHKRLNEWGFESGLEYVDTNPDKVILILDHLYGKNPE